MGRRKTTMPAMMPVKDHLTKEEAMAFLNINEKDFAKLVADNNLSLWSLTGGRAMWYSVKELRALFNKPQYIIIKQTA